MFSRLRYRCHTSSGSIFIWCSWTSASTACYRVTEGHYWVVSISDSNGRKLYVTIMAWAMITVICYGIG